MNKEQLKEAVGELNLVDTVFDSGGVTYIDAAVSWRQVYALISQLDETEKVVVPKLVADEFDHNKKPYWEVDEAKDVAHILKCAFGNEAKPSEFLDWVRENPEDYVMAVRNGYEVEKQKLYCVLDKQGKTLLVLMGGEVRISGGYVLSESTATKDIYQLTEKQIKDYDERFWGFAVEVAE